MAIDPRISLAVQQASVAPAIDLFNRVKQQRIQNQKLPGQMLAQDLSNRLMEQQVAIGGIDLENAENQRDIASLAQFSILNKEALQQANEGDSTALQQALQARIQQLGPERSQQSQEALQLIQAGQGQQAARLLGNSVDLAARSGLLNQSQLTAGQRVTSSQILDDGTTIQSLASGGTKVISASGEELSGDDRVEAIKKARQSEIDRRRLIKEGEVGASTKGAGQTKALQTAVTKGSEAFDKIGKLNTAISNYDEVVRLIDEGAQTGVISSKLPSFKKASIELDNLQGSLGLDVIGNTTFGALSGSELQFALDTALPKNLDPQDLKVWVLAKKKSQEKLKRYMEEAAAFLSSGKNTISDFLEMKKAESVLGADMPTTDPSSQIEQPQQSQPTVIRFDAQGNMINGN